MIVVKQLETLTNEVDRKIFRNLINMLMNVEIDDEMMNVAKLKSKNLSLNKLCTKIVHQ